MGSFMKTDFIKSDNATKSSKLPTTIASAFNVANFQRFFGQHTSSNRFAPTAIIFLRLSYVSQLVPIAQFATGNRSVNSYCVEILTLKSVRDVGFLRLPSTAECIKILVMVFGWIIVLYHFYF